MTACAGPLGSSVLPQLDGAAVLLAYALPQAHHCSCRRHPCVCRASSGGTEIRCELHRLESRAALREGATGLQVWQQVGRDTAGRWRCRVTFLAQPAGRAQEAAAIPYDGRNSRSVTLRECAFDFGSGWRFHGSGAGETYPILRDAVSLLYVCASGSIRCGHCRGNTTVGAFAVAGALSENGDFSGTVACRVPDPEGRILRGREVMSLEAMRPPDPGAAFVIVRALSTLSDVTARRARLQVNAQLRSAEYLFAANGESLPLHAAVMLGSPLGELAAEVQLERSSDGESLSVRTERTYRFRGSGGRTLGTANASLRSESATALTLSGASGVEAFCYAGSCPITGATGVLGGLEGVVCVTGSLAASPLAISETALFTVFDSADRLHEPATTEPRRGARPALNQFLPIVARLDELAPQHREWRAEFRKHARPIAAAIASRYNDVRHLGDFEGLNIDESVLHKALEVRVAPFNQEVFERYGGPALGTFKIYHQESAELVQRNELYSYWDRTTYRFGKRYCKFITGSYAGFVPPWETPDFSTHRIDPIVNSYREDVGVVSCVHVYQGLPPGVFQERTSFAYKMPGPHEVMWIVKDLVLGGKPAPSDVFMTSHEWKDCSDNVTRYLMVGMFWRLNSERGEVEQADDVVWRALYTQAPGTEIAHEERAYVGRE